MQLQRNFKERLAETVISVKTINDLTLKYTMNVDVY